MTCKCDFCRRNTVGRNLYVPNAVIVMIHQGEIVFTCRIHFQIYKLVNPIENKFREFMPEGVKSERNFASRVLVN